MRELCEIAFQKAMLGSLGRGYEVWGTGGLCVKTCLKLPGGFRDSGQLPSSDSHGLLFCLYPLLAEHAHVPPD